MSFGCVFPHIETKDILQVIVFLQAYWLKPDIRNNEMLEFVRGDFSQSFEAGDFGTPTQFINVIYILFILVTVKCLYFFYDPEHVRLQD